MVLPVTLRPGLQTPPPPGSAPLGTAPQPRSHPRPTSLATGVPLPAANERLSSRFHVRFYQCVPVTRATAAGLSVSARRLSEPDSRLTMWRRGEFPLTGDSAGRN